MKISNTNWATDRFQPAPLFLPGSISFPGRPFPSFFPRATQPSLDPARAPAWPASAHPGPHTRQPTRTAFAGLLPCASAPPARRARRARATSATRPPMPESTKFGARRPCKSGEYGREAMRRACFFAGQTRLAHSERARQSAAG